MSFRNRFYLDSESLETRVMMTNTPEPIGLDLASIRPESVIEFGGAIYFGASAGTEGTGLWKTNGLPGDVTPVFSGEPGEANFKPMPMTRFQDQLLFTITGFSSSKLYVSDGTTAGTQLLATASHRLSEIVVAGNLAYVTEAGLSDSVYVWVTDGTIGGTYRLSTPFANQPEYEVINDTLYFVVEGNSFGPNTNATIWTSDGTNAGTSVLSTASARIARGVAALNDDLFYFTVQPNQTGFLQTLYRLDLPSAQVTQIAAINASQGDVISTKVFNGQLFSAHTSLTYGNELFVSDGTVGNFQVLKDINPGPFSAVVDDVTIVQQGGVAKLAFSATNGIGRQIWITDGTESGTQAVTQNFGTQILDVQIQNVPGGIAFIASDRYHYSDIWLSDLTPGAVATRIVGLEQHTIDQDYFVNSIHGVSESLFAIYNRTIEVNGDIFETSDLLKIDNLDFTKPLSDLVIDENSPNGTSLGFVPLNPFGDTIHYSIVKGNEQGYFSIDPNSGAITVANNAGLNFEARQYFDILVFGDNQSSNFRSSEIALRIEIADVNEAPTMIDQTFNVDENAGIQVFGQVIANDPDADDTLTYELVSGPPISYFDVHPTTGELFTTDAGKLDYEMQSSYQLQIRVTDSAGLSQVATITVQINDLFEVVDPEVAIDDVLNAIDEFLAAGDLTNGQANPIRNLLNQALKLIADDRVAKAVEKLRTAVTRVENLVNNGTLTSAEGMPLIDWLEAAIDSLLTV